MAERRSDQRKTNEPEEKTQPRALSKPPSLDPGNPSYLTNKNLVPNPILKKIVGYLSYEDIVNLCQTDPSLNSLCQDDTFWQELLNYRYPYYPIPSYRQLFRRAASQYAIFLYRNDQEYFRKFDDDYNWVIVTFLSSEILSKADPSNKYTWEIYTPLGYLLGYEQVKEILDEHPVETNYNLFIVRIHHLKDEIIESKNQSYGLPFLVNSKNKTAYVGNIDDRMFMEIRNIVDKVYPTAMVVSVIDINEEGQVSRKRR